MRRLVCERCGFWEPFHGDVPTCAHCGFFRLVDLVSDEEYAAFIVAGVAAVVEMRIAEDKWLSAVATGTARMIIAQRLYRWAGQWRAP